MTTLVLVGGNSIKNQPRIEEVNSQLLPFYNKTHIQYYKHWGDKGGNMDVEYESKQLHEYLTTLAGDVILFCKSLGCLLGLKVMVEQDIYIKQCIFVGFPLAWTHLHTFPIEHYLKKITCPVLWIQKTNDPAGGYDTIKKEVGSLSSASICKEMPGDDHDYKEINLLKQIILDVNAK